MLLYDLFYPDGASFDNNVALSSAYNRTVTYPKGTIAVCKNGEKEVLKYDGKQWTTVVDS